MRVLVSFSQGPNLQSIDHFLFAALLLSLPRAFLGAGFLQLNPLSLRFDLQIAPKKHTHTHTQHEIHLNPLKSLKYLFQRQASSCGSSCPSWHVDRGQSCRHRGRCASIGISAQTSSSYPQTCFKIAVFIPKTMARQPDEALNSHR